MGIKWFRDYLSDQSIAASADIGYLIAVIMFILFGCIKGQHISHKLRLSRIILLRLREIL